jgi:hypothetical protein
MSCEDLEWLLHQFSADGSSLPVLKSLGPKHCGHVQDLASQSTLRSLSFKGEIEGTFRDILSRSPYIFAANKRQEALLVEAATREQPTVKYQSSVPSHLQVSPKRSPPYEKNAALSLRDAVNRHAPRGAVASPTQVSCAAKAFPCSGRLSAPPALETASSAVESTRKHGKQALILRLERLRSDDDELVRLHQQVERHLQRSKSPAADAQSPIRLNRRNVKLLTLQNRISRLEAQRVVLARPSTLLVCVVLICC